MKQFLLNFVDIFFQTLIWILLIRIILSWFRPSTQNKLVRLIFTITEPLLEKARRIIPPTRMGLDFSPIIIFLALSFLQTLLTRAIMEWVP